MRRIAGTRVDIASLTGRYYGMDRDRRWDRTRLAYDAMVHGIGTPVEHPVLAVQAAYQRGETDEFIRPLVHHRNGRPGRHDARRRRRAVLQLPQRPDAPDRERARRRRTSTSSTSADRPGALLRHHDAVRPDLSAAAGLSAVQPRADPGRGPGRPGADPVPDGGDGEVPARHLLLQRRLRAAVPGRGALPHPLAARGDVRPGAGDERRRHHRRALPHDRSRAATISSSATTPTPTWWDTPACCRP